MPTVTETKKTYGAICNGADAVLADLRAGHKPISFNELTRDGRFPTALSGVIRVAEKGLRRPDGKFVILESARVTRCRVTSGPAIERFLKRLNSLDATPTIDPSVEHERALCGLAAAGI